MARKKPQKRPNGAGSVYWSGALNRFVGAITLEIKDGKAKRRPVYGPRGDHSATAKLGVEERMNALRAKRPTAEGRTRFGEYAKEWLAGATHLEPKTRSIYQWALDGYVLRCGEFERTRLQDIDRKTVKAFFAALTPMPPRTRKDGTPIIRVAKVGTDTKLRIRTFVHRVLQEAVEDEIIDRNPADRLELPKPHRRMQVWQPDEALFFLREARGDRLYALYLLALTTTMGPAELFALQKPDLHLKGGYLWVTEDLVEVDGRIVIGKVKAEKRRRRIDLPAFVVAALHAHLKANMTAGPHIFTSPEGMPMRARNFREREYQPLLKRIAAKAEAEAVSAGQVGYVFPRIRFYDMRHTCNALMGYLGVSLQLAKDRMGHSSIATTIDVYGHLFDSQQREVAQKFDAFLEPLKTATES